MPRITVKTNVFLNREKKYRMTLEFKEAIELIPCEKASFVMADFEDEAFMLFGDEAASDPCAAIEVAVIQDAIDKYDKEIFVQVLGKDDRNCDEVHPGYRRIGSLPITEIHLCGLIKGRISSEPWFMSDHLSKA